MLDASQVELRFKDYLQSHVRRGAILISGAWGSGKTHLALTRLQPIAESEDFRTAYLSVADIETQDAFERGLLFASWKLLNSKAARGILGAAGGAIDSLLNSFGISVRTFIKDVIAIENAISDKTVIFIDDLERSPAEIRKRILYRLARLSETKGAKIVILADEQQIKSETDNDYARIKEKAISLTLEFQPSYKDLAQVAVNIVYDASSKNLATTQKWAVEKQLNQSELTEILTELLSRGSCRNLRTAIAAAIDACELVNQVSAIEPKLEKNLITAVARSTIAYAIELRDNKENSAGLRKYASSAKEIPWIHFISNGDPLKEYLVSFESKYVAKTTTHFLRSSAILDFIEKGGCDIEILRMDVLNLVPNETTAPTHKRLEKYQSLPKDEFDLLTIRAVTEIRELKIRSIHSVLESAQILFYFSERSLIPLQSVDLRVIYIDALEMLSREYLAGADDISLAFEPAMLWGQPQRDLQMVIEYAQEVTTRLDGERFERLKKMEIDKLLDDPSSIVTALISVESPLAMRAGLREKDADQIADILEKYIAANHIPHFALYKVEKAISHRYSPRGFGRNFKEELPFLERLNERLEKLPNQHENKLLIDATTLLQRSTHAAIGIFRPNPPDLTAVPNF